MAKVRGIFFTIDGLFASLLIVVALVTLSRFFIQPSDAPQVSYMSQDIVNSLSRIKVSEVIGCSENCTYYNCSIRYPTTTSIIEQIGEFYVLDNITCAKALAGIVSEKLVPPRFGFAILMTDRNGTFQTVIMNESQNTGGRNTTLVSSRRLVSGFEKFKPLKGATSKVYLEGINEKTYSSYTYFGGYVGQGNISTAIRDLPAGSNVTGVYMEADSADSFTLAINGNACSGSFAVDTRNLTAEAWNITSCAGSLVTGGVNNVTIRYSGQINLSYISGGFIRVDYKTDQISPAMNANEMTYWFPGINGIANLYDAFYVPGTLNSMNIYLHFSSNYTTYLQLGRSTVYESGQNGSEQSINLTNANLTSFPISLNYADMSNTTVPIRFASYNMTFEVIFGHNADVVLITDLSGSMKARIGQWSYPPVGNAIPNCKASDMADPNSRKLGIAGCLDSEFNNVIMNESQLPGNRLWLADYTDNANPFYTPVLSDLTHDNIEEEIVDRYKSKSQQEIQGGTCICCALNQAYEILKTYSNDNRTKAVVLMSDGIPTYCCGTQGWGSCNSSGTGLNGVYLDCGGDSSDCNGNDCNGAINNAINSSRRLKRELNATVYAVGMGPLGTCSNANRTLTQIAQAGNGTVFMSTSGAELSVIYNQIASDILSQVSQSSQTVSVKGNISRSVLMPDSYIRINYTPIAESPSFDEIAISIETPKFSSCSLNFDIPTGLRVTDAKVTSYSGPHWTDNLKVNGNEVFNLTTFSSNYIRLGDPFFVYVPVNYLVNGTNSITLRTADAPENITGCSTNDTLIYTGFVKSSVAYSSVLEFADGCTWNIDFDDGDSTAIKVPPEYAGSKVCNYTLAQKALSLSCITAGRLCPGYDMNDTYDDAMYKLLDLLDYDDNGAIFVNLEEKNFVVGAISVGMIPYPWGPAIAEVRVWK